MATQKKTGGSRTSSGVGGGRRAAPTAPKAKSRRQAPPSRQPYRREAGAVICLLLALFAGLGYFNMEAIFINLFCGLIKGLLG